MEENLKQLSFDDLMGVLTAIVFRLGWKGLLTIPDMVQLDKILERLGYSLDKAA